MRHHLDLVGRERGSSSGDEIADFPSYDAAARPDEELRLSEGAEISRSMARIAPLATEDHAAEMHRGHRPPVSRTGGVRAGAHLKPNDARVSDEHVRLPSSSTP